jgi:glucose-6-phosphate 1-epimerase
MPAWASLGWRQLKSLPGCWPCEALHCDYIGALAATGPHQTASTFSMDHPAVPNASTSSSGLTQFLGQPAVELHSPDGARAVVLLQGAHVVSWQPAGGVEQLYLSERAVYAPGQAVRGGVPVIFPQFERRGPLPRHGFARTSAWSVAEAVTGKEDALGVFQLSDSEPTRAIWPQAFGAELTVRVGGQRLDIELAVQNMGTDEMAFTAALHTYLRVSDVSGIRLGGLYRLRYEDSVRRTEQVDMEPQLQIGGETDRIYFDVARPLRLEDAGRRLDLSAEGFADTVVWNPGPEKCGALADMPAQGYRHMLCVEAAAIGTPVKLASGTEWVGRQSLQVLPAEAEDDAADTPGTPG